MYSFYLNVEVTVRDHKAPEASDCTEGYTCTVCKQPVAAADAHTPPETFDCTKGYGCTVCGQIMVEAADKHSFANGTCNVCEYECPHDWGEGVLTRPYPNNETETWEAGYYTYTCSVCGDTKTETVKRADYTEYDAVITEIQSRMTSGTLTEEAREYYGKLLGQTLSLDMYTCIEGEEAKLAEYTATVQAILDEIDEGIADGTLAKADYTAIDDAISAIDEALENATISEGIANELADIKADLVVLKADVNSSKADVAELLTRAEAITETMDNCAKGTHSFTDYETTEKAKCGVAGKEEATCDNGCGATNENDIPALEHVDKDGDYVCDYGCGHEFEKPATDNVCEDCGKVHTNFFSEIICFFTRIINYIKNLFA